MVGIKIGFTYTARSNPPNIVIVIMLSENPLAKVGFLGFTIMGLLPDTSNCGLRMRRECQERLPRHRYQRKPLVSDPGMHHGTCVTHVPSCMSGSLTRGGGENVPGIPDVYSTLNSTYLARGPLLWWSYLHNQAGIWFWLRKSSVGKLSGWHNRSLGLLVQNTVNHNRQTSSYNEGISVSSILLGCLNID